MASENDVAEQEDANNTRYNLECGAVTVVEPLLKDHLCKRHCTFSLLMDSF